MAFRLQVLSYSLLCVLVLACAAESRPPSRTLTNSRVGYRLTYPRDWKVTGQVVATEFATEASCQSVRVIDFMPPKGSGPSIRVRQSFAQICWRRATDRSSLDDFMRKAYGDRLSDLFDPATLGGVRAYRTKQGGQSTTFFLQTAKHRIQVVTAVAAEPAKEARRLAQVRRILASFSVRR